VYIAPTLGHTMDVNIHTDKRFSAGDTQDKICTLGTNSAKREQHFTIAWDIPMEFIDHAVRDTKNLISIFKSKES
jgi:hypothetical protein